MLQLVSDQTLSRIFDTRATVCGLQESLRDRPRRNTNTESHTSVWGKLWNLRNLGFHTVAVPLDVELLARCPRSTVRSQIRVLNHAMPRTSTFIGNSATPSVWMFDMISRTTMVVSDFKSYPDQTSFGDFSSRQVRVYPRFHLCAFHFHCRLSYTDTLSLLSCLCSWFASGLA